MKREKVRIGFVADYLNSEYSESLVNGISSCCKEQDVELLIFQIGKIKTSDTSIHDYQFLSIASHITEKNLDGIIISSGTQLHGMSKSAFASYIRSYKPLKMVSIAHELPGIPSVLSDSKIALESLINYLVKDQGCKKFGIMGVEGDSPEIQNRAEIIKKVLKKNKISSGNIVMWKSNFHYSSAVGVLSEYYSKKKNVFDFDAIIGLNDDLAFACADFCTKRANLHIPEDIIVTGFDDMQRASFFLPTLTSVNQQVCFQGYTAAHTLIEEIKGNKAPLVQTIPAKAILRDSSARNKENQSKVQNNDYICVDTVLNQRDVYTNQVYVSEWFNKRQQIFEAANMLTYMQNEIVLEKVGEYISNQLINYGFKAAAVVLFNQPSEMLKPFEYFNLPQKARLVSCFDHTNKKNGNVLKQYVEFNPSECIIPDGYLTFDSEGMVAVSLYHNTIQYGYLLMRRGFYDTSIYDLITKVVSTQIDESFNYTKLVKDKLSITDNYATIDQITHIDYLTGLKNKRGFIELGGTSLKYLEAMGHNGILVYCDIHNLRKINDNFGHSAGDEVIKAVSEILQNHFRSNDIIARVSGDKFAIISQGLTVDNYKLLKQKVEEECMLWKDQHNQPFSFSITMEFVIFPSLKYGYDLDGLMTKVEDALIKEKEKIASKR